MPHTGSLKAGPAQRKRGASTEPLRIVQVGAGGMGRNWMRVITDSPDAELVGLVDLDVGTATTACDAFGLTGVAIGSRLGDVIEKTSAQAVVNVTVPAAHHPVNVEALFAGLPVLCEKPAAPTVAQALSLAASAEASGNLLMISQSRRYYATLAELRNQVRTLGDIGVVTTEFFKAPRFGGFRDEMQHVLLVDMAIHPFDAVRYLLDDEPVAVYCEEFNPSWSWYRGAAVAHAVFEFAGGARYVYTGSWCSDGLETSWNGRWRVSGALGSASWDGEASPVVERSASPSGRDAAVERLPERPVFEHPVPVAEEIAGSLTEFIRSVRTGTVPSGEVHSNVFSLAMVEAAVRSADIGRRVRIREVMEDAYAEAVSVEKRDDVRAALESWGSPVEHLLGFR